MTFIILHMLMNYYLENISRIFFILVAGLGSADESVDSGDVDEGKPK